MFSVVNLKRHFEMSNGTKQNKLIFKGKACFFGFIEFNSALFVAYLRKRKEIQLCRLCHLKCSEGATCCSCKYWRCLMAISMISVFSILPRPFFRYSFGISRDKSARQLFMRSRLLFSIILCDRGSCCIQKDSQSFIGTVSEQ